MPIPGTRRRERIIESVDAATVALWADDFAVLDTLAARLGVAGHRYGDDHLALVNR